MNAEKLLEIIGFDFYAGVPDSQLRALCDCLMSRYGIDPAHHIIAANEGNCAAIAAGYHLATGKAENKAHALPGHGHLDVPCFDLLALVTRRKFTVSVIRGKKFTQDTYFTNTRVGRFKIILSDEFTAFCRKHAVPIDYETYKEINSPIGKDLYAWLVYRNNAKFEAVFIPRHKLVEQFIPVDADKDPNTVNVNYARIIELLKEIKAKHYKDVRFEIDRSGVGITLFKSPTPVLKNDPRYALITADI